VQLHSQGDEELAGRLRERFGSGLRILQVLHYGAGAAEKAGVLAANKNLDGILVDSRTATMVGGTGIRFDWDAAESLFRRDGVRLVAAGGLTPENVAEAIGKLRPWGVDVASGVEASPGRKDAEQVRAFVANARRALGAGSR
jgi:phosphoribosylanthranilate isomerase